MCGLVGLAGDFFYKHRGLMKDLLFFNTLRGKDSTGVVAYNQKTNEIQTRKLTCPGYDFIQQPWIDGLLELSSGIWMGHGRFKTVGDVSRLNAHPFVVHDEEGLITHFGAHNGTLDNKYDIQKAVDEEFGTDSEALINLIAKVGPKEAISKCRGAWALTWWEAATNTIYMLRNKERPLCYTFSEDMRLLLWASESWMLRIACLRNDVKLIKNDKGDPVIYSLPEDTLMAFKLPSFRFDGGEDEKTFSLPAREGGLLGAPEKKTFWPAQKGQGYQAQTGDTRYDPDDDDWLANLGGPIPQTKKEAEEKDATGKGKKHKGFQGEEVDEDYLRVLKEAGCDWCGGPITDKFAWLDSSSLVCTRCMTGKHFRVNVEKKQVMNIMEGGRQ